MSAAASNLIVLADDREISALIMEAVSLDFHDVGDTTDAFIAFSKLGSKEARRIASAVADAVAAGTSTRISFNGRATEIVPHGTSLIFGQDGRRRAVSGELGRELARRLHSAANAVDLRKKAG